MRKSVLELMLSVMARSLSQDSKTVTMPPRHIYNYKREGTPLVGRLLGTNAAVFDSNGVPKV